MNYKESIDNEILRNDLLMAKEQNEFMLFYLMGRRAGLTIARDKYNEQI